MKLSNKVKTFYGWDIYRLTDEENEKLGSTPSRKDPHMRASYFPEETFYIFEEGENYDTTSPTLMTRSLSNATNFCRGYPRHPSFNACLSREQLKHLPDLEWVWIEVLEPFDCEDKVSAYYRKHDDYTHGEAFCCGYPGYSFGFDYDDYNKTWLAYRYKPSESEGSKGLYNKYTAVVPCVPGDDVWDKYGYHFVVEKIELLKDGKKIFRCGNPGTDDYMAFFEDEINERVFFVPQSEA